MRGPWSSRIMRRAFYIRLQSRGQCRGPLPSTVNYMYPVFSSCPSRQLLAKRKDLHDEQNDTEYHSDITKVLSPIPFLLMCGTSDALWLAIHQAQRLAQQRTHPACERLVALQTRKPHDCSAVLVIVGRLRNPVGTKIARCYRDARPTPHREIFV